MAVIPLYSCLCGAHKKVSNHWVLATITESDIRFFPWDTQMAQRDDVIVLCGEACAASLLSRALGDWKQRSTPPPGETRYSQAESHAAEMAVA